MNIDERTREFLAKLAALCSEYNVSIGGCGCCGSPSLYNGDGTDSYGDELDASPKGCALGRSWNRRNPDGTLVMPLERVYTFHIDANGVVTEAVHPDEG